MSDRENLEQAIQEACASVDRLAAALARDSRIVTDMDAAFLSDAAFRLQRSAELAGRYAHQNDQRDMIAKLKEPEAAE